MNGWPLHDISGESCYDILNGTGIDSSQKDHKKHKGDKNDAGPVQLSKVNTELSCLACRLSRQEGIKTIEPLL